MTGCNTVDGTYKPYANPAFNASAASRHVGPAAVACQAVNRRPPLPPPRGLGRHDFDEGLSIPAQNGRGIGMEHEGIQVLEEVIVARVKFGAFLAPHHPIGENPTLQFRRDLDLAEQLDKLGFDEFWCGEHHSTGWEMISLMRS